MVLLEKDARMEEQTKDGATASVAASRHQPRKLVEK